MSYKKYKWEVIAHDYNSPFLRDYTWTRAFFSYQKIHKVYRVRIGVNCQKNDMEYLADLSTWKKSHLDLKKHALKDYRYVVKIIKNSLTQGEKTNSWTENNIYKKINIRVFNNSQFQSINEMLIQFANLVRDNEYSW